MELMLIVHVLLRRWWLILIPVTIVAIITLPDFLREGTAASGGFNTTIKYSAAQEFNLPNRDGDYQDVWLASELTVNAFTEWIRSSTFRDEILAELEGQSIDVSSLGIVTDNERSVGVIYLSYPNADGLQTLSTAAINVLINRSQAYFPQLGGAPAQVTLLDEPLITPAPPPLANRFAPFIRIGLALAAGVGLAFLVEYLDPTLRSREELEIAGIQVLASIPKYKS